MTSASPEVGSICENCLRKFTIHFRRKPDTIYDGSFGFDWLRPEYTNALSFYKKDAASKQTFLPLFKGNIKLLKDTYTTGQKTVIKPHETEYVPAWLAIFADTETLNQNGVKLDLELIPVKAEQDTPIQNDGTIIKFEVTNNNIVIEPSEINIEYFMYSKKEYRKLSMLTSEGEGFYLAPEAVNIKCKGTFEQHEEINVYAIKGDSKGKVGKLMLYNNARIPKMKLIFVDYITESRKFKRTFDYEKFLKTSSLNQALIQVEIEKDFEFDLRKYRIQDIDVNIFINRVENNQTVNFLDNFYNFFYKYNKNNVLKNNKGAIVKIGNENINKTYVFLTTMPQGTARGVGSQSNLILFGLAESDFNDILIHELGHTLGLSHTFETSDSFDSTHIEKKVETFEFLQGYTANFMDYKIAKSLNMINRTLINENLRFKYFLKFQWDIMRKDKSLTY